MNLFQRMDQHELRLCLAFNRFSQNKTVRQLFSVVSRLGNGVFWYVMILLLPFIYGGDTWKVSLVMTITGLVGVLIYKLLKTTLIRQRPCIYHAAIFQGTEMLDYYSFPSGHTLHAFSFSVMAIAAFPELWILLAPFTLLVALSRVVLGLHYPTDVAAGAALGILLGMTSIQLY